MARSKKSKVPKALKRSENVVTREIEGKTILMPLHKTSKDINYLYTFNETASYVWGLLDGKTTLREIQASLTGTYAVASGKVKAELAEFVKDLKSFNAVAATAVLSQAKTGKNKTVVVTPRKKKLKWIPLEIYRVPLSPEQAVLSCCDSSGRGQVSVTFQCWANCAGASMDGASS